MKEILFSTSNVSKIKRFDSKLLENGIQIVSLSDKGITTDVEENGCNAAENALIKARFFYNESKMTTFAMDDTLYYEGIPEEKQPGVNVRRLGNKRLTDKELLNHHIDMVSMYGKDGKLTAKWKYAIAIVSEDKELVFEWEKEDFYITDKPSSIVPTGYPLNAISVNKKLNKYFSEMTDLDYELCKEDESEVVNFIKIV